VPNWNWPIARSLVGLLHEMPDAAFVASWYHATSAALLRAMDYGEANAQLSRALTLLPDDAWLAFDRACYFEVLSLPRARQVLDDTRTWAALPGPSSVRVPAAQAVGSPQQNKMRAERDAERYFRRALALDPSILEARVRLARLLDSHGDHTDALRELTVALAGPIDETTAFYANLFAGRAARALGQLSQASTYVRNAVALFPDAQSALLAQSQLALLMGDASLAIAPMRHLATLDSAKRADPWWDYPMGPGRHAARLLGVMWAGMILDKEKSR
jgi:tetratricopeptide (TPR) repeat protein